MLVLAEADAHVVATTQATFVTVGGQNVNDFDAKTTYAQTRVDFDGTAKQPQRTIGAAGALVLHPEHQEVHLQKLGLEGPLAAELRRELEQLEVHYQYRQPIASGLSSLSRVARVARVARAAHGGGAPQV